MEHQEKEHITQLEQLNKKMELVMDEKDHQLKVGLSPIVHNYQV